jgi:hypothetical protein
MQQHVPVCSCYSAPRGWKTAMVVVVVVTLVLFGVARMPHCWGDSMHCQPVALMNQFKHSKMV